MSRLDPTYPYRDVFEESRGALPIRGNGLLVIRTREDADEEYLDTYLRAGMDLLLREIQRRHPKFLHT